MKHQHEDYIAWIDIGLKEFEVTYENFKPSALNIRASLLANKATLERHKPKQVSDDYGITTPRCLSCFGHLMLNKVSPCPSLLDVTNQLDEVMG